MVVTSYRPVNFDFYCPAIAAYLKFNLSDNFLIVPPMVRPVLSLIWCLWWHTPLITPPSPPAPPSPPPAPRSPPLVITPLSSPPSPSPRWWWAAGVDDDDDDDGPGLLIEGGRVLLYSASLTTLTWGDIMCSLLICLAHRWKPHWCVIIRKRGSPHITLGIKRKILYRTRRFHRPDTMITSSGERASQFLLLGEVWFRQKIGQERVKYPSTIQKSKRKSDMWKLLRQSRRDRRLGTWGAIKKCDLTDIILDNLN